MFNLPRAVRAILSVFMLVLAVVSVSSAPGIEPGFGLSQHACELIVWVSGFAFFGVALMLLVSAIFIAYVDE